MNVQDSPGKGLEGTEEHFTETRGNVILVIQQHKTYLNCFPWLYGK